MSKETMQKFYDAFKAHDASTMASLYHQDAIFNDPVFKNLNQAETQGMWQMLIERSNGNLEIEYHSLLSDNEMAQCTWEATYQFSKTKREVHNIIHASMEFKDGLIIRHTDHFDLWKWSKMALGTSGALLGWTPMIKNKIRKMAMSSLETYLQNNS